LKRYILATAAAVLALPASALASASRGVVLSVDAKHHAIQVVDSRHVVHLYDYRGRLPRLHPGSMVGFDRSGRVLTHVRSLSAKSHTVVFYARVVRSSSHGLVLMTADGKVVSFAARQIKHRPVRSPVGSRHGVRARAASTDVQINAGNVSINILGLQPGVTVLVTETTDSAGKITITITLPSPSQTTAQQQASGVVTEVDDDAFEIELADGSDLRLHMGSDALSSLSLSTCNTVDVAYHQDAGLLLADGVQVTGNSTTGDCTPTESATGTITQVSDQGLTISTDQGPLTFSADSDVTDGFQSGDVVDVTYVQNQDGSLTATDVEYVEQDASGTVTAVSGTSMTITDSDSGQPETFVTGPNGVEVDGPSFQGVSFGDQVDVTYHQSAGQLVADSVCDGGPGGSSPDGSSSSDSSSGN
jgi:hypothetical protein